MLQRKLSDTLLAWKHSNSRKPLILRGARQVGKSTIVTELGRHYTKFVHLNLERSAHAKFFTEYGDDLKTILASIALEYNINLGVDRFLLFIDEIQEVPQAIALLRYFYEEISFVDVIAAGSLLEFAFKDVGSFPVGRVEQIPVFPLDFEEFLIGLGENKALELYRTIPMPEFAHDKLFELFHAYILVGGMPEVVAQYVINKQIQPLNKIYSSIWDNYTADIEKYGKNNSEKRILNHIISTAHAVRDRITFNGFGASAYGSREVSEAFSKLQKAGIFQLIYPVTDMQPPIIPNLKRKPKLQFLDIGLLNYAGNLHKDLLSIKDFNSAYRGYLINHIVFQELMSKETRIHQVPYFWTREVATASAEIDVVIPYKQWLIPIELKSGAKGSLKSLHEFMDRCDHIYAFRLLANKFSEESSTTKSGKEFKLINLPYYFAGNLRAWIAYIIEKDIE